MDSSNGNGGGASSVTISSPVKVAGSLEVSLANGLDLSSGIRLQYDKGRFVQETASRIFAATSFFVFDYNGKLVIKKDSQVQQIAKRSVRYAKLLADEVFS